MQGVIRWHGPICRQCGLALEVECARDVISCAWCGPRVTGQAFAAGALPRLWKWLGL